MLDLSNCQYFDSLSEFVQESIMQSGIDFHDEAELRKFVDKLEKA